MPNGNELTVTVVSALSTTCRDAVHASLGPLCFARLVATAPVTEADLHDHAHDHEDGDDDEDGDGAGCDFESAGAAALQSAVEHIATSTIASAGTLRVVIEPTVSSVPLAVAAVLEEMPGVTVASLVAVIEVEAFEREFEAADDLASRGLATDDEDDRTVADVLVEQVETAGVIVLAGCASATDDAIGSVSALLHALAPRARIVRDDDVNALAGLLAAAPTFDPERASDAAGWLAVLEETAVDDPAHGITGAVYRVARPMHPDRFRKAVESRWPGVVRSEGVLWFATRMDEAVEWSQAGGACRVAPSGSWLAAVPRDEWPEDEELRKELEKHWQEPFGDRRQEIALVGRDMDEAAVRALLDECLLTDAEMARGEKAWKKMKDPWPTW